MNASRPNNLVASEASLVGVLESLEVKSMDSGARETLGFVPGSMTYLLCDLMNVT